MPKKSLFYAFAVILLQLLMFRCHDIDNSDPDIEYERPTEEDFVEIANLEQVANTYIKETWNDTNQRYEVSDSLKVGYMYIGENLYTITDLKEAYSIRKGYGSKMHIWRFFKEIIDFQEGYITMDGIGMPKSEYHGILYNSCSEFELDEYGDSIKGENVQRYALSGVDNCLYSWNHDVHSNLQVRLKPLDQGDFCFFPLVGFE